MFLLVTVTEEGVGGKKEADEKGGWGGLVYVGFRFSCLLTSCTS